MPSIAITNEVKIGKNEGVPTILLSEAFMADESENMRVRYGEYRAVRGRLPELLDMTNSDKIKMPTDIYAITSIVSGTNTINITGDHSAGNTPLAVGAIIRVNANGTTTNNVQFTVASLPTVSSIVVEEDITSTNDGNVLVGTTPIIRHHLHVRQANQAEFLLLATAYHIWTWSNTNRSITLKFTSLTPGTATHWSIITHLDDVYATNNVDLIQKWLVSTSPSNSFADLGSASGVEIDGGGTFVTKARFLASFETYLFLFYPTHNDNSLYPLRTYHSSRSDPSDFDINGSGDAGLKNFNNTPDFLVGVGFWQDNMVVFKQQRHIRGTLVSDDTVFRWDEEELKVGALSTEAITNDRAGRLYWLASDLSIREIRTPVQVSQLADKTIKNLNTSVAEFAQMTFIDTFGTINLALAIGSSTTNNKIISFNPDTADTFITEMPIRSFGNYTRQAAFTYDTLPFNNYADWGADWIIYDTQVNVVGFPLDLASDYEGTTFNMYQSETDDGVAFTRSFVFNTNMGEPFPFKRVNNGMYGIFRRQGSGTVSVYIRINTSSGWTLLGTMSLVDSRGQEFVIVHLPFDERFQNANFKLESTDRLEIIGIIFRDFELDDDR